jgi:integrase
VDLETMPLYKRDNSPYWYVRIGSTYRRSTWTEDYEQAKEAERVAKERLWRLEKLGDRGAISFDEAADRWLNGSAKEKRRDREVCDWLGPIVGSDAVRDVAESAVFEELRKEGLAEGWSHSTIDRMMGTVSAVLRDCFKRGELERTPMVPMYRPPLGEPRFLTPPELDRLCNNLPMHSALGSRFAVHSLLRMRAMLKLRKERVDLKRARAWIPGAHQKAARTFGFPLNSEAVRVLRALWTLSPPSSPYIFTWNGKPIDDCNTRSFQEGVKRAGLEPLRWHDLRHTGASWAVQSGVTLPELMILGDWKDYRSVLRYAHFAPTSGIAAAEKMAQFALSESGRPESRITRKRL